jgi:hypothetical protein
MKEVVMVHCTKPSPRPRRPFALVSLSLATMLVATTLAVPGADARTSWRTFGAGSASGRGEFGSPSVSVSSTTRKNPENVRFAVSGRRVRTDVSWSIFCWNDSDFASRSASGSFTARLPITRDLTKAGRVSRFQFCEVDVFAFYIDTGKLSVRMHARYP